MENKNLRNSIKYVSLGIEFGSTIIAFTFIGNIVDKKLDTKPLFTIIGIFIGFVFGIYRLYRISKIINKG